MFTFLLLAETPAQAQAPAQSNPLSLLLTIGVFFAVFYFFMIRPGQKQQKKRAEMLNAMGVGDEAVTIGGIHGRIIRMGESDVELEVSSGVNVTFERSAIARVEKKD